MIIRSPKSEIKNEVARRHPKKDTLQRHEVVIQVKQAYIVYLSANDIASSIMGLPKE
jgi:hypothetical protein